MVFVDSGGHRRYAAGDMSNESTGHQDSFRPGDVIGVSGGAGFIGSNLLLYLVPKYPQTRFVNIDCLTYAANLSNLHSVADSPNYVFEQIDICD